MFKGKIHTFVPDQISKGGMKTSISTQSEVEDTRQVFNCYVHYGRWRRAMRVAPVPGLSTAVNVATTLALHSYRNYDINNYLTGTTQNILAHHKTTASPPVSELVDHTNTISIRTATTNPDSFVPATFTNIKNRCFMCWAGGNNFIYDRSAIGPPFNGLHGNGLAFPTSYDVGIDAPAAAPTYTLGVGNINWTGIGPTMAYAWFDDVTGHYSNISPTMTITQQNQVNQKINLTFSYPTAPDLNRFNAVRIFCTQIGGSDLFPLDDATGLFYYSGSNPATVSFSGADFFDHIVLTQLQTPQIDNKKPPPFAHQVYWDGRLWGVPVSDPSSARYSRDPAIQELGVAEESFPLNNQLRIPSDDSRITGCSLVGGNTVFTTDRFSYTIVGSGDIGYRFARFSSSTMGVGDYQMQEMAGDTGDNSAAMIYVGKDSNVYLLSPSYGNVSVSDPVADQINGDIGGGYDSLRLVGVNIASRRIVLLALTGGAVLMYDFDRRIWSSHVLQVAGTGANVQPQSFETIFGSQFQPTQLFFGYQGTIYQWLDVNQSEFESNSFIEIGPLSFGRKSRKQLDFIRLYVSSDLDAAHHWIVSVTPDETPGLGYALTPAVEPDPLNSIQPPGSSPVDSPSAQELVCFPAASGHQGWAHRWKIRIGFPANTSFYDLYRVDMGVLDLEDPAVTSP